MTATTPNDYEVADNVSLAGISSSSSSSSSGRLLWSLSCGPRESLAIVPCGHAHFCQSCVNKVVDLGVGGPICRPVCMFSYTREFSFRWHLFRRLACLLSPRLLVPCQSFNFVILVFSVNCSRLAIHILLSLPVAFFPSNFLSNSSKEVLKHWNLCPARTSVSVSQCCLWNADSLGFIFLNSSSFVTFLLCTKYGTQNLANLPHSSASLNHFVRPSSSSLALSTLPLQLRPSLSPAISLHPLVTVIHMFARALPLCR